MHTLFNRFYSKNYICPAGLIQRAAGIVYVMVVNSTKPQIFS